MEGTYEMGHELLIGDKGDARFLDTRGPAWHRFGTVMAGQQVTAVQGLDIIGAPDILIVDAPSVDVPGVGIIDPAMRYIVRTQMADLPAAVLGSVTDPDYYMVGPKEFCTVLDGAVGKSVETMGMLKDGKILFVTFSLPNFEVQGDEHENYLAVYNGMSGSDALRALNTPVRVVCMNTYMMADSVASERFTIPHKRSAMNDLGSWIVDLYERALARGAAVQEALEVLAAFKPSAEQVTDILTSTYPDPKRPSDFGPKLIVEQREKQFDARLTFVRGARETVNELWQGAGTGADTKAAAGTLFGLYNATVEFEDYRKHRGTGGNPEVMGESALIGMRKDHKERAFAACMTTSGVSLFTSHKALDQAADAFAAVVPAKPKRTRKAAAATPA